MGRMTSIADKTGALGVAISAISCPACFPALASLGAAVGLGFLARWEGLFVTILLPLFAVLALLANGLGWLSHRRWRRGLIGMIGPLLVLAAVYLTYGWRGELLLYAGLALMVGVSIWDLVSPANRRCGPDSCEMPAKRG